MQLSCNERGFGGFCTLTSDNFDLALLEQTAATSSGCNHMLFLDKVLRIGFDLQVFQVYILLLLVLLGWCELILLTVA